jgi:hypothetical protein
VDDTPTTDDDDEVADWFSTDTDPAIAQAVARAEAEARSTTPPLGSPASLPPTPPASPVDASTQQLPGGPYPGGAHRA